MTNGETVMEHLNNAEKAFIALADPSKINRFDFIAGHMAGQQEQSEHIQKLNDIIGEQERKLKAVTEAFNKLAAKCIEEETPTLHRQNSEA